VAVITYLPGSEPTEPASAAVEWPEIQRPGGGARLRRMLRPSEIKLLTVVALAGYVASGLWVRFSLHFWINDALNRSDDALYVTIGRDPHLGAIGFYWPPLPQLLELPFMPFLRPFGEEILAGPFMTAVCMAATIPVLARIGRRLGVGRVTTFLVCVAFAVTPDMIYTASNGMAESCFILSGAVTMLGFLTWIDTKSTSDLLVFSLGLSMLVMTRLEGPFIMIALVVIACLNLRNLKQSAWQALVIALPPAFCYGFWCLVQYILLGDPLFFLHQNGGAAPPAGQTFWLPSGLKGDPTRDLLWVGGWVVVLAPILFLLAATIVLKPWSRRTRGGLGILASLGAVLSIQAYQAWSGPVFGDPRYFVMAVIFGAVAALWLAAGTTTLLPGRLLLRAPLLAARGTWNVALVGLLVLGACTGSYALTSGRVTHVEHECSYFQYGVAEVVPFLGRTQEGKYQCHRPVDGLAAWEHADHWVDAHLTSHDRILADNASNYPAGLFSTRPKLFIVRNDRDWSKTVAYPNDVDYILTQSTSATGPPSTGATYSTDDGALLIRIDPAGWHLAKTFSGAQNLVKQATYVQIWHFVPSPAAGSVPRGTESNV
jgi:hypothetical protein